MKWDGLIPSFSYLFEGVLVISNSNCAICGKEYQVCKVCDDTKRLSPWKIHTDTSEHYKIYQIIRGYSTGIYDINEAKSKLQTVDLSDLNELRDNIKLVIENILNQPNPKDKESVDSKSKKSKKIKKVMSS